MNITGERPRTWLPGINKTETPVSRLDLIKQRAQALTPAPAPEEVEPVDDVAWDEEEIPGPEMVSTLEENDSSEPRPVGTRDIKPTKPQTRTTTFRPSLRARSRTQRSDRAPASLGTESPVVEVPRGALNDGGAAPKIRPRVTQAGGEQPDTLVDAARNRLTDPGSIPGRSTKENEMQNGMKEFDTKKWMTVGEAARLLDVTPQRISMLGSDHGWSKQRVGRFIVYDRATVARFAGARFGGLTKPEAAAPKSKKPKRGKEAVELHVDGKLDAVEKHAPEAAAAPMKIRIPGIGVEIKSREGDGCAYGDVMFRRHVDGTRFSIANALRDMADVLAWTEFADADVDGGDVVVLMRLKKTA